MRLLSGPRPRDGGRGRVRGGYGDRDGHGRGQDGRSHGRGHLRGRSHDHALSRVHIPFPARAPVPTAHTRHIRLVNTTRKVRTSPLPI